MLALRLASPFLEVKGGDLKCDVQLIRIGSAWFNLQAANAQELGGSFDVVEIARQLWQHDPFEPHLNRRLAKQLTWCSEGRLHIHDIVLDAGLIRQLLEK
jgi:hypothetical protein